MARHSHGRALPAGTCLPRATAARRQGKDEKTHPAPGRAARAREPTSRTRNRYRYRFVTGPIQPISGAGGRICRHRKRKGSPQLRATRRGFRASFVVNSCRWRGPAGYPLLVLRETEGDPSCRQSDRHPSRGRSRRAFGVIYSREWRYGAATDVRNPAGREGARPDDAQYDRERWG